MQRRSATCFVGAGSTTAVTLLLLYAINTERVLVIESARILLVYVVRSCVCIAGIILLLVLLQQRWKRGVSWVARLALDSITAPGGFRGKNRKVAYIYTRSMLAFGFCLYIYSEYVGFWAFGCTRTRYNTLGSCLHTSLASYYRIVSYLYMSSLFLSTSIIYLT